MHYESNNFIFTFSLSLEKKSVITSDKINTVVDSYYNEFRNINDNQQGFSGNNKKNRLSQHAASLSKYYQVMSALATSSNRRERQTAMSLKSAESYC